jgi:molybdate-binding protein/DNA-binding XRE family transcriptional regulator
MSDGQALIVRVRQYREKRGWSQQQLAARSGLSRTGISAIETGRVAPSTSAALAIAAALGGSVEELFVLAGGGAAESDRAAWAWQPDASPARFWQARVGPRILRYPVESGSLGLVPHDGVAHNRRTKLTGNGDPDRTLVLATCDPAAGLLVSEAARQEQLRIIVLMRSSTAALRLLGEGVVHAAGVHLAASRDTDGNAAAVRARLGDGCTLMRVADWEEGVAVHPHHETRSVGSLARGRVRWIARDAGSGARQCLDEILGDPRRLRHVARDHQGVADAIRSGLADAGVCVRLVGEEAGLGFLPIRSEAYDLCFAADAAADWRIAALQRVVRSSTYRRMLRDLPGYEAKRTGETRRVR